VNYEPSRSTEMCVNRICCCSANLSAQICCVLAVFMTAWPAIQSWFMVLYLIVILWQNFLIFLALVNACLVFAAVATKSPALMYVCIASQFLPILTTPTVGICVIVEALADADFFGDALGGLTTGVLIYLCAMYAVTSLVSIFVLYTYFCCTKQLTHERATRQRKDLQLEMQQAQLPQQLQQQQQQY
ncbi:hypothetical protein PENTCL1PPCAC_4177, partial [Pristionchus entomophagus]